MLDRLQPPSSQLRREWWWFALVMLLLGLLLAADLWGDYRRTDASERQHLQQQVTIVHDNVVRQLTAINQVLETLAQEMPRGRHGPDQVEQLNSRLQAYTQAMLGVRSLSVLNAQGDVLASNQRALLGKNFSQREYFTQAVAAPSPQTLVVSAPFEGALGTQVIVLARRVHSVQGRFDGIVVATLDPEDFLTLLQSVRYSPDMLAGLAHGNGQPFVLASAWPMFVTLQVAAPETGLAHHLASGEVASVQLRPMLPGGVPYLAALRTIAPPALLMSAPLVAGVGREAQALWLGLRTKVWQTVVFYLLTLAVAALGLLATQRRWRRAYAHEQALAQENALLHARWQGVLEATQQGVWDVDVRTGHTYYSPMWKKMLGYSDDAIAPTLQAWTQRIHPDDLAPTLQAWQRHIDGDSALFESTHRVRHADGSYHWTHDRGCAIERDAQGKALRLVGTQTDINESYALQERLDHLAENVPGLIYQYQSNPDGHSFFPYASQGAQEIYGCSPQELRASAEHALRRIHPDDHARVAASIAQSMQQLTLWQDDYRVLLPGRGERWLSGHARPQRLEGGVVLWHGYIHDTTEAKQQALQQQETERLLRHLMNEMPVGLCMVDEQHRMYFRNRRFVQDFGYTEEDVPTLREWAQRAYPDPAYRDKVARAWKVAVAHARTTGEGDIPDHDFRVTAADGTQRTVAMGGLLFGHNVLVTFVDRTEQQAQSEALRKLAYMDALTHLANRRHFDQALQAEWRRCRRSHKPLAVVMIDLDYFKQYNDVYGHPQGDACLKAVAEVLRQGLARSHDLVARYGGEEFICLLPECDAAGAAYKAETLCRSVQALGLEHPGSPHAVVTISAGVACVVPDADGSPQQLVRAADAQLYLSKQRGRNRASAEPPASPPA